MSPVPEPMQGGRGGPRDEEEGINPPVGLVMGPPMSSSDEEPDHVDSDDSNPMGYQPLPQDFDEDQDEAEIDYSSLSGLMSALNAHGPNVVEHATEETDESDQDRNVNTGEQGSTISFQTLHSVQESTTQRQEEELLEQAAIWNSPKIDRFNLDGSKVEEIKSVMASFTLPQSAIPPWAQNLSDEDWKNQVAGLLSRPL